MNDKNTPDIQKLIARRLEELGLTRLSRMFSVEHNVPRGTHKAIVIGTGGNADTVDDKHASDLALAAHQHPGTDITSIVAAATAAENADTVDLMHAAAFAAAIHQHGVGGLAPVRSKTYESWDSYDFYWGIGDRWIVWWNAESPHGGWPSWETNVDKIATNFDGASCTFYTPQNGDIVFSQESIGLYEPAYYYYVGTWGAGGYWVEFNQGGDADTVDEKHASDFLGGTYDTDFKCLLVVK